MVVELGGRVRGLQVIASLVMLAGLWIVAGFLAAGAWWLVSLGWNWWPL